MRLALDESARRRDIQVEYNQQHGITPTSIAKAVSELIETEEFFENTDDESVLPAEYRLQLAKMSSREITAELQRLEQDMLTAAKDLDFELAATLRDQMTEIQSLYLLK